MPPALIELMKRLDYSVPLGSTHNNVEVHNLLLKIEDVNWNLLPIHNFSRDTANTLPSLSPGRNSTVAGDYVWIDPTKQRRCSRDEAGVGRAPWRARRQEISAAYRDLDAIPSFPRYVPTPTVAGPSGSEVKPASGTPVVEEPVSEVRGTPPAELMQEEAQDR